MRGVNEPSGRRDASGDAGRPVAYVWPYVEWGGAQRYFMVLMRQQRDRGGVTVVLPRESDPALVQELEAVGARIVWLPRRLAMHAPASLFERVRHHMQLWRVQRDLWRQGRVLAGRGDVLHCDVMPVSMTWPLVWLARRTAVIVTMHTGWPRVGPLRRWTWRHRLAWLHRAPGFRIIAANRHVRESLRPYLSPAAFDAIPVAYSPFEAVEIAVACREPRDARRANRLTVVTGGQFIPRKGTHEWLTAAARLRERGVDIDLTWIGPQPVSTQDLDRIRAVGANYVAQSELPDGRDSYLRAVARADLFVLPSLEDGLPLAIVEAMACGVPVVSTPINGIPEAVIDGVTGWLVPPGDAEALADIIQALAADPARRRAAGEAARLHAERFDARAMVETTMAVYAEAAAEVARR